MFLVCLGLIQFWDWGVGLLPSTSPLSSPLYTNPTLFSSVLSAALARFVDELWFLSSQQWVHSEVAVIATATLRFSFCDIACLWHYPEQQDRFLGFLQAASQVRCHSQPPHSLMETWPVFRGEGHWPLSQVIHQASLPVSNACAVALWPFQRTWLFMSDTARPRHLCIFISWPNSSMRGEAGGWQRLTVNCRLGIDMLLTAAPAEQQPASPLEGTGCAGCEAEQQCQCQWRSGRRLCSP